jgi:polynucleotide 5'-kinase involved in rRNA processing
LPMCIGIGIVRAIDLENQLLYILTPIDPSRLNALAGTSLLS